MKPEKPSKEEYAVAKWLRNNVPNKKTKFLHYSVEYFTAVKAVDALMDSNWAKEGSGEQRLFLCREDVVDFLERMLEHKFFHRAKKVVVSEQELKGKQKKKEKKKDELDEKEEIKREKKTADEAESSHAEGCKEENSSDKKQLRKKRKIRLEMHMEQLFVDGLDAYVWLYDPIPFYYWVCGTLVVLGSIGICLFPLWPPSVRKGVYYLSVAAAGVLVFILALAIFRVIVFCIIWTLTLGRHHFWLLPNLVEDVGFLASFWPLYHYEYRGSDYDETKGKKKKSKKKKDKDSDAEEDGDVEVRRDGDTGAEETGAEDDKDRCDKGAERHVNDNDGKETESESESSQKSNTGRDFVMVEKEDAEDSAS